jgi:hypothetical protein
LFLVAASLAVAAQDHVEIEENENPAPTIIPKPAHSRRLTEDEARRLLSPYPSPSPKPVPLQDAEAPPAPTSQKPILEAASTVPPAPPVGTARIIRYSPEGRVGKTDSLVITFDRPMDPASRPATLTPQPPGEWFWLGGQTLIFQPRDEFPMATRYQVEVADAKKTWTFETTPPKLSRESRNLDEDLQPLICLSFDQHVEPDKVLAAARMADGPPLRLVTAADWRALDPAFEELMSQDGESVWVTPQRPLEPRQVYQLLIPAGSRLAQGPLLTPEDQMMNIKTYSEFSFHKEWRFQGDTLEVKFTNPLDPKSLKKADIQLTPAIANSSISLTSDGLRIEGAWKRGVGYQLTLPPQTKDIHGQELGEHSQLWIERGFGEAVFFGPSQDFIFLDPYGSARLTCAQNLVSRIHFRAYAVKPRDWSAYRRARDAHRMQPKRPLRLPGTLVVDEILTPDRDKMDYSIDLKPTFAKAGSQLLVVLEPQFEEGVKGIGASYVGWVQHTNLAVNLAADSRQLLVWTNGLKDGQPVPGAQVNFTDQTQHVVSDSHGLATLPWQGHPQAIWIESGSQSLFFPPDTDAWRTTFRPTEQRHLLWYVTDDRQRYRPGETVSVKGWLRRRNMELPALGQLSYRLRRIRLDFCHSVQSPTGRSQLGPGLRKRQLRALLRYPGVPAARIRSLGQH